MPDQATPSKWFPTMIGQQVTVVMDRKFPYDLDSIYGRLVGTLRYLGNKRYIVEAESGYIEFDLNMVRRFCQNDNIFAIRPR